jgi:hypothetical protein
VSEAGNDRRDNVSVLTRVRGPGKPGLKVQKQKRVLMKQKRKAAMRPSREKPTLHPSEY